MTPPQLAFALKTTEAARRTGMTVHTLHNYVRHGVIPPPPRDGSGHYLWLEGDIAAALEAWELRRPLRRESAA
jgi:DNA-binding transcriptional MerR regulator